jgi:hypothetical protein
MLFGFPEVDPSYGLVSVLRSSTSLVVTGEGVGAGTGETEGINVSIGDVVGDTDGSTVRGAVMVQANVKSPDPVV